jgi:hypothetical protein
MFAGQVMVGFSWSATVTVLVHSEEVLPEASVALQVIVVVPFGYGALKA